MEALRKLAESRVEDDERLGALLPVAWPPPKNEVMFLAYHSEALPTEPVAYRMSGPVALIHVNATSGEAHREPLDSTDKIWIEREGDGEHDLQAAEEALLARIMGRVTASASFDVLRSGYCALRSEPNRSAALEARATAFATALTCPEPPNTIEVPEHNRDDLKTAPPRPPIGKAEEQARHLFDAIRLDEPALAREFFFPRDAFLLVKGIRDPGKYWDKLEERYEKDIHSLHRKLPDLDQAKFDHLELVERGGWTRVGEEGNSLPYWVSRHSWLHYRVGEQERKFEVRVLITWDDQWYITHLSEFH